MYVTSELRLWWQHCPAELEPWWDSLPQPARSEERTDLYLSDFDQAEIGIKGRDGRKRKDGAEIKQLVAKIGDYRGKPVELWVKSDSPALNIAGLSTIAVHKALQLRDFGADGTPSRRQNDDGACHVELAEVRCAGAERSWWTLGFEASGALGNVQTILRHTLDSMVPSLAGNAFSSAIAGGYPLWLSRIRNSR